MDFVFYITRRHQLMQIQPLCF